MSFPMGDVPAMFGVCTDVIIRAYRAVGIDLQANIHAARIGSGDRSIAHRRTFTLRRYFASRGASLPVTDFIEDFLPGDVVTYDRPQNRGSRDHIAIVSDIFAPSGRPMIVHNRGWGPQLEDALFVDRITGHYRYQGRTEPLKPGSRLRSKSAAAEAAISTSEPQTPQNWPSPQIGAPERSARLGFEAANSSAESQRAALRLFPSPVAAETNCISDSATIAIEWRSKWALCAPLAQRPGAPRMRHGMRHNTA